MRKLYGIIGDPVGHSMSPLIHNYFFQKYEINAEYRPFHVRKEDLQRKINELKEMNIAGFNVTIPHKEAIIPYLDDVDEQAKRIGAVNTVVQQNGKWIGYNTDGIGFLESLKKSVPNFQDKKIVIIGAGGAARAIYFTLAQEKVSRIDLCNRTRENAEKIIADCRMGNVESEIYHLQQCEEHLDQYDLIIQTTPVGMKPNVDQLPISLKNLSQHAFVYDIIYNPLETKFLQMAKLKGAGTENGLLMLLYQAAFAFQHWTTIFPDFKSLKPIIEKKIIGG